MDHNMNMNHNMEQQHGFNSHTKIGSEHFYLINKTYWGR